MRKLIVIFGIFIAFLGLGLLPMKAFAATCGDGTIVDDPSPNLGSEDRKAVLDSLCVDHGGYGTGSAADFSAGCKPTGNFLGFPTWYKYLRGDTYTEPDTGNVSCHPRLGGINDIWKVAAAVIELLLRVASLVSIGFIIYGGVTYILSQSQPDKTKQALRTIINALVGLVIAIISTALVSFIAGRF